MASKSAKAVSVIKSRASLSERFAEIAECLGDPPLLDGEDKAAYAKLSSQLENAVDPRDAVEYLWVRDVIDLTWEIQRLRRLKTSHLTACTPEGLSNLLRRLSYDYQERNQIVEEWTFRDEGQATQVDEILKASNLTSDAISAETFAEKIDFVEKVDRMIASAQARRVNIIREVDRHREALARQLMNAIHVKDAEYTVIEEGDREAAE